MSKKRLKDMLRALIAETRKLREENAYLKFKLEEYKARRYKPKNRPPKDNEPGSAPKKKGGLFGHTGWFRRKPKSIDKIEEVRLDRCPECGSRHITQCRGIEEHTQEDITPPRAEVTLFRKYRYYCRRCKKTVMAKAHEELPKSYLGPKAKALAVFLKHVVKISEEDVKNIFSKLFGIKLAASSISGFRERLAKEALPVYKNLIELLKQSKFIHADETGWKLNGKNHWLWKLSNKKISVTHIDKSRGQKVVEDILGKKYEGILISDFLSAYNKIAAKAKQRCLGHLLKDLKKVIRYWHDDKEVLRYCRRLKRLFEKAIELHKEYKNKGWGKEYYRSRRLITESLVDFSFPNPNKRILKRFAKRLERHKKELFTFLYEKDIDFHNNHAEQEIRPNVIFRKITFQNRSEKGMKAHSVLSTILQTAKLNNLDPIKTLEKILLSKDKTGIINPSFKRRPNISKDIFILDEMFKGHSKRKSTQPVLAPP